MLIYKKQSSDIQKFQSGTAGVPVETGIKTLPSIRSLINDSMNRKMQPRQPAAKPQQTVRKDNVVQYRPVVGVPMTSAQKEARRLQALRDKLGDVHSYTPQSNTNVATDIALNPLTAFGYAVRNESLPNNFTSGNRNVLDHAVDIVNPAFYLNQGKEAIGNSHESIKHLANGEFTKAGESAASAAMNGLAVLPLAGEAVGPVARIVSKAGKNVAAEFRINTQLSAIKKEGLLKGLSEHEIAVEQFKKVGITSNQRKGYKPILSELAEKYITPQGYQPSSGGTKFSEIIDNIKKGGVDTKTVFPERVDAWKLYLGKPQVNKTFAIADTAPAIHPSYKPGDLKNMDIYNIKSQKVLDNVPNMGSYAQGRATNFSALENPISISRDNRVMGGYNRVMTKEGTQYNDIWDLDPSVAFKSLVSPKIASSPMLEKLFWKKAANGVMSPRGVKVPISKVFGKPFMSHGNVPYSSVDHVQDIKNGIEGSMHSFEPHVDTAFDGVGRMAKMKQDLSDLAFYPKHEKGGLIYKLQLGGGFSYKPRHGIPLNPSKVRNFLTHAFQPRQETAGTIKESTNVSRVKPIYTTAAVENSLAVKNKAAVAKAFLNEWMASPKYVEMMKKSAPKEYINITQQRKADLANAQVSYMHMDSPDKDNTAADSNSYDGSIRVYSKGVNTNGTLVHDLSHSSDRTGKRLPQSDLNRIGKFSNSRYKTTIVEKPENVKKRKDWASYLSTPTETRSRLNEIRFQAKNNNLYDPYKQKVTPEIYDTMMQHKFEKGASKGYDPLRQLKTVYSDDQIINLLNTVAENKKQTPLLPGTKDFNV